MCRDSYVRKQQRQEEMRRVRDEIERQQEEHLKVTEQEQGESYPPAFPLTKPILPHPVRCCHCERIYSGISDHRNGLLMLPEWTPNEGS